MGDNTKIDLVTTNIFEDMEREYASSCSQLIEHFYPKYQECIEKYVSNMKRGECVSDDLIHPMVFELFQHYEKLHRGTFNEDLLCCL